MREIKFRAKTKKDGKMVYGYYSPVVLPIFGCQGHFINEGGYQAVEIDQETVGQYTGLKDKNGAEIYEGDIVKFSWMFDDDLIGVVEFCEYDEIISSYYSAFGYGWCIHSKIELKEIANTSYYEALTADISCSVEVIGNIYYNPELLNEVEE